MAKFRIRFLQLRLVVFLLLPVTTLLFAVGAFGWIYARQVLLDQWQEAAVLKLQRAAHFIDMRLERPMEWIEAFQRSGGRTGSRFSQQQILDQLRSLERVVRADLQWSAEKAGAPESSGRGMGMGRSMGPRMRFSRGRIGGLSQPRYNADQGTETVMLSSRLHGGRRGQWMPPCCHRRRSGLADS